MKYTDFHHVRVTGDGSCFFRSVATILITEKDGWFPNKQSAEAKTKLLRKQSVQWLQNNLDYKIKGTGLTIRSEIEEDLEYNVNGRNKTIQDYLDHMKTSSAYAGQIEIYAMAHILNRNIRVYIHNKDKFSNSGLGYQMNTQTDIMKDIFLYHNLRDRIDKPGLHHFDSLYPKVKLAEESKKQTKTVRRKTSPRRSIRRKTSPRRTVRRKVSPRRSVRRKTSPRRSVRRKVSPRRTVRRKVSPRRTVRRKASPRRTVRRKTRRRAVTH